MKSLARLTAPYLRVIRHPRYFRLWLAQMISNAGDTLNYIALVLLIFRLTGSGLALATSVVFQILPIIIIAPVAGVVIDRVNRKGILIGADLTRGLLALALSFANEIGQVYALVLGLALATTFFRPTLSTVIPTLLDEDDLLAANSISWSTEQLVQILAAATAGAVVALSGVALAFQLNALSFFISAGLIATIAVPRLTDAQSGSSGAGRFWADLRGGLSYARQSRFLQRLLVVQMLASLAVGGTSALLIVLSSTHLRLDPAGFSWLLIAIGLGALIGPFAFAALTRDYRNPRYLFAPYLIRGAGDILIALLTPLPIALLLLFIYGLCTSTGSVVYQSLMQSRVPRSVQGRAFTLMDMAWSAMEILSLALAGWLNDVTNIQTVYYAGGALLLLAGLVGLIGIPRQLLSEPETRGASGMAGGG